MVKYKEQFEKCCAYIRSGAGNAENPDVMLLKGGSYKIKGYYLENNKLNDIRGASANLSYVEDVVIPDKIKEYADESCIIYNGGGNIFCILPAGTGEDFALMLEEEAQKYLVSANTAYVLMRAKLSDIQKEYRETMRKLEEKLSERKKLKISINSNPRSEFNETGIPWSDPAVIELRAKEVGGSEICGLCKSKIAGYELPDKVRVCGSCLHKNRIGISARVSKYRNEYKKYTDMDAIACNSLGDIDKDYVAVVYGDGNNMGQIIQNFNDITDMMRFSDEVKAAANRAVFETMKKLDIRRFEVVGLGGDDVFVIVSGKIAMEFAVGLIEAYNDEFKRTTEELKADSNPYKSTMSVGVCIAKTHTPIRIMLEIAEEKLKSAKTQAKRDNADGCDVGSVAFAILDNPTDMADDAVNKFGALSTLQPYRTDSAKQLLQVVRSLSARGKTALRNIYNVYCNADVGEEAELFFKYHNAKAGNDAKITLPQIAGYTIENGLYCRNGKKAFIWKDILDLLSFSDERSKPYEK